MRLAIIDRPVIDPGQEIGPIFVNSLTKPEIGEKVRLSFVDGKAGEGEIIFISGIRFEDWSYRVRVIKVDK